MNRRSVLRFLGLAPVAAPAAVAAAAQVEPSAPAVLSRRFTGMFLERLPDGGTRVVFDAQTFDLDAARRREMEVRIEADAALAKQIDDVVARANADAAEIRLITAEQRISVLESRIGLLTTRII